MGHKHVNEAITLPVLPGRNRKLLYVGVGRMSGSVMPDGRIFSVSTSHPENGLITLTYIEQMPDGKWYDTEFVRDYRRRIAVADSGFGLNVAANADPAAYLAPRPVFTRALDQGKAVSAFDARNVAGVHAFIQRLQLNNSGKAPLTVPVRIGCRLNLTRCSYGQLTERGPIPIPPPQNQMTISGNHISIRNQNLNARADLPVFDSRQSLTLPDFELEQADPVDYEHSVDVELAPGRLAC